MFITLTAWEGIEVSIMIESIQHFADNRIYLIGEDPFWIDVRQTREEIADMITKANTVTVQNTDLTGGVASPKPRHRVPSRLERMPGAKR